MKSKIISEEVLLLHMVGESEKLLSEIERNEVGDKLYLVRVKVRMWRYDGVKGWGPRTLIYERDRYKVDRFMRWKWFFRYLQAKAQVETPKQLIVIESISYVEPDRDKVLLKVLKNKLIAAKADRTKIKRIIRNGKEIARKTSLFSFENEPFYIKAVERLQAKEDLIKKIESEINELQNDEG